MDTDEKRRSRQRDDTADKNTVDAVERVRALTAADVMSRILLTVTPEQHMVLAWELLMSSGVHHLPVVEEGRCIAVLDDRLLAREWVVGPLSRSQRKIRELCTGPAPSVSPDTPVDRVARLMHLTGADAVTVIGDRQLVGLITVHDLVAVLAGEPHPHPIPPHLIDPTVFTLAPVPMRKDTR